MRRPLPLSSPRFLLIIGAGALLLSAIGLALFPAAAVHAWLVAALFFTGLSLGALVLLFIDELTGQGGWARMVRPPLLAMAAALPVAVTAMVVPAIGIGSVLPWMATPAILPAEAQAKLSYLDPAFLIGRTLVIVLIWCALAWFTAIRPLAGGRRRQLAVLGLVAYALTLTFFSTDWMVALQAEFYSTIYAMLEASGEMAGAFALVLLILYLAGIPDRRPEAARDTLVAEDLANLFFGFVLLWIYLAFMQWLIVWSGDLPEETGWYIVRIKGVWLPVLALLIILHFVIPTCALVNRHIKRSPAGLALVAGAVLAGHFLDVLWRVMPVFGSSPGAGLVVTPLALIALGSFWAAGVLWSIAGGSRLRLRRTARA